VSRLPDVEPVLRAYLADTGDLAPDRVLGDVAARIARQPQRRSWRLRGRHFMNGSTKLAAGLAAVLIVGFVGWQLLSRSGGIGGQPTANPSPTVVPTATLGTRPTGLITDMTDGPKPAGRYRSSAATAAGPTVKVVYELPDGWSGIAGDWLTTGAGTDAPDGLGIAFLGPGGLFSDPCHWDANGTATWPQPPDVSVGPTVADLATALQGQSAYQATSPTPVTIGDATGVRMQLTLPSAPDPATCDVVTGTSSGAYFVFGASSPAGVDLFAQGPANIWDLWIVDVGGSRVVIVVSQYAATPQPLQDSAEAIVQSILFNR